MEHLVLSHGLTLSALVAAGFLFLIQLVVADLTAIRAGHQAGYPVPANSDSLLFRTARAHANTSESIATFAIFAIAGVLAAADPVWLGVFAWGWVGCRVLHMAFYYGNQKLLRSTAFGVSLIMLIGMGGVAARPLL